MKNLILSLLFAMPFSMQSQIAFSILDQNNAGASISDGGNFFYTSDTTASYRVHKDSLQGLIYSATNWFGGVDGNGQLKLITTELYGGAQDLWPGPLTINGSANVGSGSPSQTIWTVTKAQIHFHLTHFQNPGYVPSAEIATWPAHGDIGLGFDYYLAPFVDVDLDGNYDPSVGDYPCIKGDRATFMVMNDKKYVHGSGTEAIGLELQYMFYQYDTPDLANTTFMDLKIINRGTITLFDFHTSFVMDGDLGNPIDDFVGCDTNRNVQYYYNDSNDETTAINVGYGIAPPSFGVVCLSDDITSATSFNGSNFIPTTGAGRYNVMKGINADGSAQLNNLGLPTTFMHYDSPSISTGWNEINSVNPGDKKSIMSINMGTLSAFAEKNVTYAIVYSREGVSNISNVDSLLQNVDKIQAFYDNSTDGNCAQSILSSEELMINELTINIYPNPTQGEFSIVVEGVSDFEYTIQDVSGRKVLDAKANQSSEKVSLNVPSGVYFLTIQTVKGSEIKRLVIR